MQFTSTPLHQYAHLNASYVALLRLLKFYLMQLALYKRYSLLFYAVRSRLNETPISCNQLPTESFLRDSDIVKMWIPLQLPYVCYKSTLSAPLPTNEEIKNPSSVLLGEHTA
jgi:hypothetical protein